MAVLTISKEQRAYREAQLAYEQKLTNKKHALTKSLARWWVDLDKYKALQPDTRNQLQLAINDMRSFLDDIELLAHDQEESEPVDPVVEIYHRIDSPRIQRTRRG